MALIEGAKIYQTPRAKCNEVIDNNFVITSVELEGSKLMSFQHKLFPEIELPAIGKGKKVKWCPLFPARI